jgi:hypothetical protein
MDLAQIVVSYLGWVFFAVWGTILAAVGIVAFGADILAFTDGTFTDGAFTERKNKE